MANSSCPRLAPAPLRLLVALVLFWPAFAWAQPREDAPLAADPIYLPKVPVLGSTRVVALGGAYTGVAEGAQGFSANLASIAHRAPKLDEYWDWGLTLSLLDVPFFDDPARDLDNDGRRDDAESSVQLLLGGFFQYRYLGFGSYVHMRSEEHCIDDACDEPIIFNETTGALATAMAFGDDDFIAGFGLFLTNTTFNHDGRSWNYNDIAFEFDVLYRPHRKPWRFGVSVKPQVVAALDENDSDSAQSLPAGRRLHSRVVTPSVLSIGVSFRLGRGAFNYNRLSPVARRDFITRQGIDAAPPELPPDAPTGRWLLSTQLDITGAVAAAVPLSQVVSRQPQNPPPVGVGDSLLLTPRMGLEHDTVPDRLRLRVGSYLESSAFSSSRFRPHVTGGLEFMLFHYWQKWSISASFDFARQYANAGVSIGFWE